MVCRASAISSALHADQQAVGESVERRFAEITEKRIRRGSFPSVASLEKAIREYLDHYNEEPKLLA
jgi:hypothetical protein